MGSVIHMRPFSRPLSVDQKCTAQLHAGMICLYLLCAVQLNIRCPIWRPRNQVFAVADACNVNVYRIKAVAYNQGGGENVFEHLI